MATAALHQLEQLLNDRKLGATLAKAACEQVRATAATGTPAIDRVLDGGWRRGELSELVSARGFGATALIVDTLARATREGELAALVDAVDRFDVNPAAARGLDPSRLLWVRGPALTVELARPAALEQAVRQAVRAFDLVLRAGGFSVVVLDLLDLPVRALRSLPMTTWLRLAHANEGRQTAAIVIGRTPLGRSARGVTLHVDGMPRWTGVSPQSRRFEGVTAAVQSASSATRLWTDRDRPERPAHVLLPGR
jgi:hypothetical protein